MKFKWHIIVLAFLGVGAALSAAVLVASLQAKPIKEAVHLPSAEVNILVAAKQIPAMSVVDADSVVEKTILRGQLPETYFTEPVQIIGRLVIIPMIEGQAFRETFFPVDGSGIQLAGMLPPGKRALTVALSDYSGLEGLLYPGSRVDVLASFTVSSSQRIGKAVSTTLLQNIEVLAVNNVTAFSTSEQKEHLGEPSKRLNRGLLVTLMVDTQQGEALQLAMEHGVISLALRNPKDTGLVNRDATLLSGGRLAQLAELLGPTIFSADAQNPSEPDTATEVEQPSVEVVAQTPQDTHPKRVPAAIRQFEVVIIRGVSYETRSFPLPTTER